MTDSIKLFKLHLVAEVGSSIDYTGKSLIHLLQNKLLKIK